MSSYPLQPPTLPLNHHTYHTHKRNHSTAPYSIPPKNNNIQQILYSQQYKSQQEYSTSLPLLSRDFVVRRISEGETGRLKEELKCEACGKGYKHISSLAKHLWEHTPEWNVTKKLLISKHQQVQLLELASILCSMTEPPITPKTSPSRNPSDSPMEFDKFDQSTSNSSNSPSPFDQNLNNNQDCKIRQNSISQFPPCSLIISANENNDYDGLLNINSYKDEKKFPNSFHHKQNSLTNDQNKNDTADDDVGVFGEMD